MSNVLDIETAIEKLPQEDFLKLRDWVQHRFDDAWDKEFESDVLAGSLDDLASEALAEHRAGRSKPFPPHEEPSHS